MIQLLPAALGLGTAILGHIGKKEASKEAKKMAAIQAKYSPWTGVAPDLSRAEKPSLMPDLLAGAGTALAMSKQNDLDAAANERANLWQQLLMKQAAGTAGVGNKMAQPVTPTAGAVGMAGVPPWLL